ncbi:MAG: DUF364 domain-containing protein [Thermodesulfobacteriota bacterium]|nr:DUF364 domain-containing protein [Thermodesulfobacteriota bacterium]
MLNTLLSCVSDAESSRRITKAVVSTAYCAVEVEGAGVGLCANLSSGNNGFECCFDRAGCLAGSTLKDLIAYNSGNGFVSRSLALAALNAVKADQIKGSSGDIFENISIKKSTKVAMVGYIAPVVRLIVDMGAELSIFERRDISSPLIHSPEEMPEILLSSEVVIVSATSIINDTLEEILGYTSGAEAVVLMGPSTPMAGGDIFAGSGVTWLAGASVADASRAMEIVMEGGGTQALYRAGALNKIIQKVY